MTEFAFHLRPLVRADAKDTAQLLADTVMHVNCRDYTPEQCRVWAQCSSDLTRWERSFTDGLAFVAVSDRDGTIVGFGDLHSATELDRLYVHRDWQGKGVARAVCAQLESRARQAGATMLSVYASRTAQGFFARRGYRLVRDNTVVRGGIELHNAYMILDLISCGKQSSCTQEE